VKVSPTGGIDLQSFSANSKCSQVDIVCGTTNELLSVAEPEKCEYLFKVTSPALCWPDFAWEKHTHEQGKQPSLREEL
jgi:hypothetical protein